MALQEYEHMNLTPVSDIRMGDKVVNVYGSAMRPIFRTADVAAALGIQNHKQMIADLDKEEKGMLKLQTEGGMQKVSFITEFGLYEVLFVSRKSIAKDFKRKVKAALFVLRVTGKVTAGDIDEMNKGVCDEYPLKNKGVCKIYPHQESKPSDVQPPSVKQLRAEFEYIRQAQRLLNLTKEEVTAMTDAIAIKYGLTLRTAKAQ